MTRPNFYRLLDLDPSVQDPAAIDAQISAKKAAWTRDMTGAGAKAQKARQNYNMVADIRRVMLDPQLRADEARAVAAADAAQRESRQRAAEETLRIELAYYQHAGGIPLPDVARLATESGGMFTEAEVAKLAAEMKVPVQTPRPAAKQKVTPLDDAVIRRIVELTSRAQVEDLYRLLDAERGMSPKLLVAKADACIKDAQRAKETPQGLARSELAGKALDLFKDDASKAQYDAWLEQQVLVRLEPFFDTFARRDGLITLGAYETLVKEGMRLKVDAPVVEAYLEGLAQKRKIRIQRAVRVEAAEMARCGHCGALAAPTATGPCSSCGMALVAPCPQCEAPTPSSRAICDRCGCTVGDGSVVRALFAEGQKLEARGELAEAVARFDEALNYWPKWKVAAQARAAAGRKRDLRATAVTAIEADITARRLVKARAALTSLVAEQGAAGTTGLQARIDAGLAAATAAAGAGDIALRAGRVDEAWRRYGEALASCDDLESARRGLLACPPAPPANLVVRPNGGGFGLRWAAGTSAGTVSYTVRRRAAARPTGPEDGELVAQTASLAAEDPAPASGTPWFYSVFSVRDGVASRAAAASGPHLYAAEVADLAVIAGDRSVTLTWRTPPGARVEVCRGDGVAPPPGGGATVPTSSGAAQDAGLRNGQRYVYRVVVAYPDPITPGSVVRTAGLCVDAVPAAPPLPVTDLQARLQGGKATLRWTTPAGASVQIRQSAVDAPWASGEVVSLSQVERLGTPVVAPTPGQASADVPPGGRAVFLPLSVLHGTAVVGVAVSVVNLPEASRVHSRSDGAAIVLTWDWPPGVERARISWSPLGWPGEVAGATTVDVTRAAYQEQLGWTLPVRPPGRRWFLVQTLDARSGAASAGVRRVETMNLVDEVLYEVRVSRGFFGPATVELAVRSTSLRVLPAMVAVARDGGPPLEPSDGRAVLQLPRLELTEGTAVVPLPKPWSNRSYLKLFLADDSLARDIRLLPAGQDRLRMG